jgi:hypothetical protein
MLPAYIRDFDHFFYANLDEPITDDDFSDWVVSLFDNQGNETQDNIGTLVQDIISGSEYRFYTTFNILNTVPLGFYYIVVYNSVTEEIKYQSNCIQIISENSVDEYVYFQYRNSSNLYNYNYETLSNYTNLFLRWNVIEQQPEIELEQYVEQTTGRKRNLKSVSNKVLTIESYFFDDEANDMMLAVSLHDDLLINGKVVDVKTAFSIETNKINSLQKGTIEFYDEKFSTINLNA